MSSRTNLRDRAALFGGGACVLVACSVDTTDIKFRPDIEFGLGGSSSDGGVLNKAGSKGKAGEDTVSEGGDDTGGSDSVGGTPSAGSTNGGVPAGGAGNVAGTNGVAGAGGTAPVNGYPCMSRQKLSGLIADFSAVDQPTDTWQDPTNVVTFGLYAFPPNSPPALTFEQGAMVVTAKVSQPSGAGIWFSPCVDASSFSVLEFAVTGTRSDGQQLLLRVGVGTNDTKLIDPMNRTGTCMPPNGVNDPGYCRPPVTEVMVPLQMGGPAQVVAVKLADLKNGSPVPTLDMSQLGQLAYVEWGFIYLNQQTAYDAQLTIDNVGFK